MKRILLTSAILISFVVAAFAGGPPGTAPVGPNTDLVARSLSVGRLYQDQSPTAVIVGDSITALGETSIGAVQRRVKDEGWTTWMQAFLHQRLDVISIDGEPGETSTQLLARFQTDAIDLAPKYCFIQTGTNDVTSGVSSATIISNLQAMISMCHDAAITPIILTILPASSIDTSAESAVWFAVNKWILMNHLSGGFIAANVSEAYVDPDGSYPVATSSEYVVDGVHPSANGAYLIGKKVADVVDDFIPARDVFTFISTSDPLNILSNPCMIGTDGNDSDAEITDGDVASGWTVNGANGAGTVSKVARDGITGEWQRLEFTASADSATTSIYNYTMSGDDYVGETVYAVIELYVNAAPTNLVGLGFYVNFSDDTDTVVATLYPIAHNDTNPDLSSLQAGDHLILKTSDYTISTETAGIKQITLSLSFNLDDTGTLDVYIGKAGIVQR